MGVRLLLVEDEPELLQALRVRLTAAGFLCETARNGKEALACLARQQPDVIIADLVMPEMDGYEMVERVQSDQRTASIPVIVLTAVPGHALDRRAAQLHPACIMHKPFESEHLVSAVRALVDPQASGGARHG